MDDYPKIIEGLWQRIAELEKNIAELKEQLEQERRKNAQQAAPFRQQDNKKVPNNQKKQPGRKTGHEGTHRPVPEHIDQEIEQPLNHCPQCNEPLSDCRPVEQFIEEIIPAQPRVIHVDKSRGSAVVKEVLGDDYQGVLVSDCLSTYRVGGKNYPKTNRARCGSTRLLLRVRAAIVRLRQKRLGRTLSGFSGIMASVVSIKEAKYGNDDSRISENANRHIA